MEGWIIVESKQAAGPDPKWDEPSEVGWPRKLRQPEPQTSDGRSLPDMNNAEAMAHGGLWEL